jgi:cephalosporin hydroxylase
MLDPSYRESTQGIEEAFHVLYYNDFENTWETTRFMGTKVLKNPMDLWNIHEIIWEVRPDVIIESGTAYGGSSVYMAHQLDLIGKGHIFSIDIHGLELYPNRPPHKRLSYVKGSSTDAALIDSIFSTVSQDQVVLVVLDSDHRRDHVIMELELLGPRVTGGSYLIVEDTNVNSRPVVPEHGPGPAEALEAWLPQHPEFVSDLTRERLHLTFNPGGYLRRIA